MKEVKITVLKKTRSEDLIAQFAADKDYCACEYLEEGQVFSFNDHTKPADFCDEAWRVIYPYALALHAGGGNFYDGGWVNGGKMAICSCSDGLRPVFFKLEAQD